jgi:hypothetical protein
MKRRSFLSGIFPALLAPLFCSASEKPETQTIKPDANAMGIITIPFPLTEKQIDNFRKSWNAAIKSGKPIVLTGGITYAEYVRPSETEINTQDES